MIGKPTDSLPLGPSRCAPGKQKEEREQTRISSHFKNDPATLEQPRSEPGRYSRLRGNSESTRHSPC
jgi:hypothetical protein